MLWIFQIRFSSDNFPSLLGHKLAVTFGQTFWRRVVLDHNWFDLLLASLNSVSVHVRFCWLRTVVGGWTTSLRMHEIHPLPCIFGCLDCVDNLEHYMLCPILWNISCEIYSGEDSLVLEERLCLRNPTIIKLARLAITCDIYHTVKNDSLSCSPPCVAEPLFVQTRACEFAKALKERYRSVSNSVNQLRSSVI